MRTFSFSLALALIAPALACEVENLDVGNDQGGTAGSGGGTGGSAAGPAGGGSSGAGAPPIELPPEAPPRECATDEALEKFVGVWEGVEEDFTFQPIRPVRLEIRGASTNDVCGTFLYGDLNPPPRASDPNAGYPPTAWNNNGSRRDVLPGLPYEITGGARATTLRFSISAYDLWKDWCALQPPLFDLEGNVHPTCIENAPGMNNEDGTCTLETDRGPVNYDIEKCELCRGGPGHVCTCTDAGCKSLSMATSNYEFTLTEEDGVPTLTAEANVNTQFHLQRVD